MVISHSLKYVYFAVPKTASTSISNILIDKCEGEQHGNWHNVVAPVECCDYYKFCTVRHPYTRAISLYFHILRMGRHRCHDVVKGYADESGWTHNVSFLRFMRWMTDLSVEPKACMGNGDLRKSADMDEFGEEFTRQSIDYRYGRDLNQVEFLCYAFGVNYMDGLDYIIRMEDIENEFNKLPFVENNVTIPCDKKCQNEWLQSIIQSEDDWWRSIIKKESEELIYQWAKDDFIAFNYERGGF